jgi:2-amino-4-hydroxy-6-hydroxymethyldihydropteridine diphosphokinase/dihydropteroate synthase
MQIYLGLGSNLGKRRANLRQAIVRLQEAGLRQMRLSPVVESPALLPERSPAAWNRPFLNLVLEAEADGSPRQWLRRTQEIQEAMGRAEHSRWAPRLIDIDLLLWGDRIIREEKLSIPHPELHRRAFVVSPLVHLRPDLRVPGRPEQTVLQMSQELPHHIPLWMGVVNLTPDSFSDGGKHTEWAAVEPLVEAMAEAGVHIVDLGAESTRPGASPVSAQEEWSRLQPVLERLRERWASDPLGPRTSIDTRHPEVVEKALRVGVDIVNDVSGLTCDAMICLARDSGKEWVAMHHLTIPAERGVILSEDCDPCQEVEAWLERQLERWERAGLDLGRVIFDPGIGFGKNSLQSLEILRHVSRFRRHGLRVLAGHSRKSFMKDFSALVPAERDMDTIGASLSLCRKGVDILRIHDVPRHARAYLAWAHVEQ